MRGDGSIFTRKGTSTVWIKFWHRGKEYREPGGKTEAEARRKLRSRLKEIAGDRFIGPQMERLSVREEVGDYRVGVKV